MRDALGREDVERFRTFVARRLGLQYEDAKLDQLADVLRRRMALAGSARVETYLGRLGASPEGSGELRALAEQLTVNETFFFRNADNFRALAEAVLPDRIRANARERRLRILSAGCASGEEPYSVAILVREALPDPEAWNVEILGLDVNPASLTRAAQARYSTWSLRATRDDVKRRYFRTDGPEFTLIPAIQKMVTFEERNLVDDDPLFWQSLACDVVFCRNVLMYFSPDQARAVVRRIGLALRPGGFLFLGHAETLRGLTQEFHLCHTHDTFYYRRGETSQAECATAADPAAPLGRTAETLPAAVESMASWVEVIQRASERIATLAGGGVPAPAREAPPARMGGLAASSPVARTWDLGLVLELVRQERFSEALELIGALPPDSREDPDALLLRAVLLTNGGRLDEAAAVCGRLLVVDELHAGAHYLLALCREHAGDLAGAVEHDQTAAYLDGGFSMPHLHLGLMAKRSGDATAAQRELRQALDLLAREESSRLLLFGGGFSRDMLVQLCRLELRAAEGEP